MKRLIYIFHEQNPIPLEEFECIVALREDIQSLRNKTLIFVNPKENYRRSYFNFNKAPLVWRNLFNHYANPSLVLKDYLPIVSFGLSYREHKLFGRQLKEWKSLRRIFWEASSIIKSYYHYYSIACAILTALFFSRVGLAENLPKVLPEFYGQDFLDDFFFPAAFIFTIFESTADLLLGEALKEEEYIVRAFLSFLLWKHTKRLLKISYNQLIKAGVKGKSLWITL
ncbi:MAG: hypothetical protein ABWJ99_05515 [Caldimicrobium sp.]